MDHFTVNKSFYDLSSSDLKDLWDSDIESSLTEFKMCDDDWNCEGMVTVKPHVILNDRLMSDAILEDTPIKVEHSYCSQSSPSMPQIKDESEDECLLPTMPTKSGECVISTSSSPELTIKSEPMSEPSSPVSSCPPSPTPSSPTVTSITILPEVRKNLCQPIATTSTKSRVLKRKPIGSPSRIIKIEPGPPTGFPLPPTPPSSTSSDSEGNISPSHPPSPTRRMFLSVASATMRQPIQTPLISSQPKGSTGTLILTEEEKRTLLAEGYPIPVRLPLTKAEEKSLKKIRRKIKNKISAQESRRKKKEYMDALERKVQRLSAENTEFAKKICSLEDINSSLVAQVSQMQALIDRYQDESKSRQLQK